MNAAFLPAPARIFYEGLTAFTDTFAFYPGATNVHDIAMISITGPREAVRAIQSALIMNKVVKVLLPGDTLVGVRFVEKYYGNGKIYSRSVSSKHGQALHTVSGSADLFNGHIAYGFSDEEFRRSLEDKVADALPIPTHPHWSNWWIRTLEEQGFIESLVTSTGFRAAVVDYENVKSNRDTLLAQLKATIKEGVIPLPKAEKRGEAA